MKKFFFLSLSSLTFFPFLAFPQAVLFKGKVIDAQTQEILPFVHIYTHAQNTTVSNAKGEFELRLPRKEGTKVTFSILGYKSSILEGEKIDFSVSATIALVPDPQLLNEVVITSKKIPTALKIMEKMIKNISKNYPQEPYAYEAYFKEWLVDRDTCKKFTEAFITITDHRGYRPILSEELPILNQTMHVEIAKIRASHDFSYFNRITQRLDTDFPENHHWLRRYGIIFDKYNWEKIDFKLSNLTTWEDKWVYQIAFECSEISRYHDLKGTLFIEEDNFAVLKIDFSYDLGFVPNFEDSGTEKNRPAYYRNQETMLFKHYEKGYLPYFQQEKAIIKYPRPDDPYLDYTSQVLTQIHLLRPFVSTETTQIAQDMIDSDSTDTLFWENQVLNYTPEEQKMRKQVVQLKK